MERNALCFNQIRQPGAKFLSAKKKIIKCNGKMYYEKSVNKFIVGVFLQIKKLHFLSLCRGALHCISPMVSLIYTCCVSRRVNSVLWQNIHRSASNLFRDCFKSVFPCILSMRHIFSRNIVFDWMEHYRSAVGISRPSKLSLLMKKRARITSASSLPESMPSFPKLSTTYIKRRPSAPPGARSSAASMEKISEESSRKLYVFNET